jgi:hypothetical protein
MENKGRFPAGDFINHLLSFFFLPFAPEFPMTRALGVAKEDERMMRRLDFRPSRIDRDILSTGGLAGGRPNPEKKEADGDPNDCKDNRSLHFRFPISFEVISKAQSCPLNTSFECFVNHSPHLTY